MRNLSIGPHAVVALALAAATGFGHAEIRNTPGQLGTSNGRFVFGQISEFGKDQYMLDTQTGRLWRLVRIVNKDKDGKDDPSNSYTVLDYVPYSHVDGKLTELPPK